jgi:hypothetical protein
MGSRRLALSDNAWAYLTPAVISGLASEEYSDLAAGNVSVNGFAPASSVGRAIYPSIPIIEANPAFEVLESEYPSADFAFSLDVNFSTGITGATFQYGVPSGNQTLTEYWNYALATGEFSGPFLKLTPMIRSTLIVSQNWAGWSFWDPGTPLLASSNTDETWPNIEWDSTGAQNVPVGYSVYQMVSIWNGLTTTNGTLWQTGFLTDASDPYDYNGTAFAEFVCTWVSSTCPTAPQWLYNVGPARTGDSVSTEVGWSGTEYVWGASISDYTQGNGQLVSIDVESFMNGFHAYYSNEIVEAPAYDGYIQQIAEFSQTNFYDIQNCEDIDGVDCYSGYTLYESSDDNVYQLSQDCVDDCLFSDWIDNTQQVYNFDYGGHWSDYGYPDVTWVNSDYNWCTVAYSDNACPL